MNRLRINNETVFVTVLSACLGLVVAGASSHAHHTASSVLSEIASVASANLSYGHAASQRLKLRAVYSAPALSVNFQSERRAPEALYRSRNPLSARSTILVITSLPRAALDVPLA